MAKKSKTVEGLAAEFKELVEMIPKLDKLLKAYDEITAGYVKYRKNGGASIPGVEKHLGAKIPKAAVCEAKKESDKKVEKVKSTEEPSTAKSPKKKSK